MRGTTNHFERLRERTERARAAVRCVGSALLYVSCTCLALAAPGCGDDDGVPPGADAATPTDDAGVGARATLVIEVHGGTEPLDDGLSLESASVSIMDLRARNDRGGDFEPMISNPAPVDLAVGASYELVDVAPATYGRVTVGLAPNGAAPTLAMRVSDASRTIEVRLSGTLDAEAQCSMPVALEPGGTAHLRIAVELRDVAHELADMPLPAPVGGVIHVDEASAPDVATALLARLAEAFELRCEPVETGG